MVSSKSNKTDQHFGSDLYGEICSWMPAKAAIKFSSLSKSLSGLLSDPLFVEKQSLRFSHLDEGFLIQGQASLCKHEFHVLSSRDGEPSSSSWGIPERSLTFLHQLGRVLDSSQGLLLVKSERKNDICGAERHLIYNPATGSYVLLPLPPQKSEFFRTNELSLVCHPRSLETRSSSSNYFPTDYTVIAPLWWEDNWNYLPTDLAVYRNGKWEKLRHVEIEGHEIRRDMPVTFFRESDRGLVIHYLCDSDENMYGPAYTEPFIVAYDLETEVVLRSLKLPEGAWSSEYDCQIGSRELKMFKWRWLGVETVGAVEDEHGIA